MEVLAKGKFVRISAKKARPIADIIRGKNAKSSLEMLNIMPQRAAREIGKVLLSAMSNAENNFNLDKDDLTISKITIDNGPALKRWRPRAKGAASSIKKRTSHITVIVSGEVNSKKITRDSATKKEQITEHEIETEKSAAADSDYIKPEFIKKEQSVSKVGIKNKIFRRKTG